MNFVKNLFLTVLLVFMSSATLKAADYTIGVGDIIEISVYQQPDLQAIKTVSQNGDISFPIVGLVKIGGMTEHVAESTIAKRLANSRVINNPEVSLRIIEHRSATVAIDGLVANPGEFSVIGSMTIHQLVSKAGGLRDEANSIVTLYRPGQKPLKIDLLEIYREGSQAYSYIIGAGDRVLVEPKPDPDVFYTYGAVKDNGRYELIQGLTVMQALALSGGRTESATKSKVKIFRSSKTGASGLEQINASEEDLVQANDVILIEESRF